VISFCIPFRTDNGHRETSFQFVTQTLKKEWPDDEILIADSRDELFSRSKSRNAAAAKATGSVLVFLDADSYVPLRQLREAITAIENWAGMDWMFPYSLYYSLTAPGTLKLMATGEADERDCVYVFPGPDPYDRPVSVGGCVIVRREAFERVGGYDERFIGWAFEDRAFAYSLEAFYGPALRVIGPLYHLWHPDVETDKFAHPQMEANRALCNRYEAARNSPVAMRQIIEERGVTIRA